MLLEIGWIFQSCVLLYAIVSFISVSFFHVLVLVLRLFATVSASARTWERQTGHPGRLPWLTLIPALGPDPHLGMKH